MKLSKSKLALAKVINENGGWVDGANWSAQDKDGEVFHFRSKPTRGKWRGVWGHHGCIGEGEFSAEKIPNWHQTALSREEYYQAYPKADADGWIEWSGGMESPVEAGVPVDVKTKDGNEHYDQLLGDACWHDNWDDANIIAYRMHKQEVKPGLCESVTRSIPEPAEKPTIEQLAADYRNQLEFANRKQAEADDAKADADAALARLERAGDALGLLIAISKINSVIDDLDWNDWAAGDLVELVNRQGGAAKVGEIGPISKVVGGGDFYVDFPSQTGYSVGCSDVKFISRP